MAGATNQRWMAAASEPPWLAALPVTWLRLGTTAGATYGPWASTGTAAWAWTASEAHWQLVLLVVTVAWVPSSTPNRFECRVSFFCQRSFDRAVMVARWYDLRLETRETRVRTLPWASSGRVTTRSMSPQLPEESCIIGPPFVHWRQSRASGLLLSIGASQELWQTVVRFAHFQVQARKWGVLGGVGGVLSTYISPKGVCDGWVKNRGWWWYSGRNETPSGQNETHLGNLYERWAKVL